MKSKRTGRQMQRQWRLLGFCQEMWKKLRGTDRAWQTATSVQREPVLRPLLQLHLVRTARLLTNLVRPLNIETTPAVMPRPGRCSLIHPQQKNPHMKDSIQCFPALTSFPTRNTRMEIKLQSPSPSESKADLTFYIIDAVLLWISLILNAFLPHFKYSPYSPIVLFTYTSIGLIVVDKLK